MTNRSFAGALAALILLSGCGDREPHPTLVAPPPVVTFQTVKEPYPVPCVNPTDVPVEPDHVGGQITADGSATEDLLAESNIELRKALRRALALLSGCLTVPAAK